MTLFTERAYLLGRQYSNASNLKARMNIHERYSTNPYGWLQWVFDQLMVLPKNSRILEIGCGPATLWAANRRRVPRSWQVTLTDFSAGMVREAEKNIIGRRRRFQGSVADAQALPFPSQQFNAVIANHMLYHIPDQARAFSEIQRVLAPGGHLFAATNGTGHLQELYDLIRTCDPDIPAWRSAGDLSFNLENGASLLSPWFRKVEKYLYPDSLLVMEVDPLIAYVFSMTSSANLSVERLAALDRAIRRKFARMGSFQITKAPGMFVAYR